MSTSNDTTPHQTAQQDMQPMSDTNLTLAERDELKEKESIIERGLKMFYEVGDALLDIRDKRLYRDEYPTFEEYCLKRWQLKHTRAYQLMDAAATITTLKDTPMVELLENERQVRALSKFDSDLHPAIIKMAAAQAETLHVPFSAGLLERTGEVVTSAVITGCVDTGNGESTPLTAALVKAEEEAYKRSLQYIHDRRNGKTPHVSYNSGENEWYTPPEYIAAARRVMGTIGLDPASSEIANRTVQAGTFYTVDDDGLAHDWYGKVWMNPPYASELIKRFTSKFVQHVQSGDITEGIVLVNNATETAWFCELVNAASAVVFTAGRIKFIDPEGKASGAPLQGQAVIYVGSKVKTFLREFKPFGWGATL